MFQQLVSLTYITALAACIICFAALYFTNNPSIRTIIRRAGLLILLATWVNCIYGIADWQLNVEPTLDGSEGSGASFGFIFIHFFTPLATLIITIFALSIIFSDHENSKR